MADGPALVPRPHGHEISRNRSRVTDIIRHTLAGLRIQNADDFDQAVPPSNGDVLVYSSTTGMWTPSVSPPTPPFDFPGPLVVSTTDLWAPPASVTVTKFVCTLASVLSSGSVTVNVNKNAVTVDTISIPASTTVHIATLSTPVALTGSTDYMALAITATGTGGGGLLMTPA